MKNKKLLLLIPTLLLIACNQNENPSLNSSSFVESTEELSSENMNSSESDFSSEEETKITLEELQTLLISDLGVNEVLNSSKVEFQEVDKRGDSRTITSKETMNIYSDGVSVAYGEEEAKYMMSGVENSYSDTYERVATAKAYGEQVIFYLVKDYEDGTLNTSWHDSADRLPVYEEGDPQYDGYYYLLKGSLPGQLTKQVSLIMYNYIGGYLLGNPDLQAYMPFAQIEKTGNNIRYYLDDFSYSYSEDDGSSVTTELGFSILVEDGKLIETTSLYKATTTRGEEVYIEENTTSYKVSYEKRVESSTAESFLNVEDYFLNEVSEVKAYYYNDDGDKEYVSLLNLPLEKYIRFEAASYSPSKAVDIEMYPYESSNPDVIYADSNVFETLSSGEATLTLQSVTGVMFEVNVRVNIPEILKIKYNDSASSIENDGTDRYIYTSTTYSDSIYVTVNPSAAKLDDIEISVSDEDVLEVKSSISGKVMELELTVKDTDKESVSITFTSKTNSEIKTTINFKIKQRLSDEEMCELLLNNTYKWTNLYNSSQYGLMNFTSSTEGQVTYYDGEEELGTTTFTYSFNGTSFNIKAKAGSMFNYNSGEITLDGNQITARVDEVTYVHRYVLVGE